jgi:phosphatidylinositol alpha-1,6-mannosyltransferase
LESHLAIRQALGIGEQVPLFVYPGDLETSSGARSVAAAAPLLAKQLGAVTVFAYRKKSPRAVDIARSLEQELGPVARFTHSVPDVLALIAGSSGILFPVDDLWGKVDLPIVLLESMALGVPVVALDWGPLSDLGAVHFVRSADPASLLSAAARLIRDADYRTDLIRRQKSEVERRFSAPVVAERYERLYLELLASADA